MYQSVEETEAAPIEAQERGLNRLKLGAFILIGIALLIIVGIYASTSRTPIVEVKDEDIQAQLTYRSALAELDPALRRARLADLLQSYPDHDRKQAAQAQLDILIKADERDWAALQEVIYDPAQSKPAKLAAIELYEAIWRPDLLGGRQPDVARLKAKVTDENLQPQDSDTENLEKQDFTPPQDKFDTSLNRIEMAGGVNTVENSYIPPRPTRVIRSPGNITEPTLRRSVKPRYPSRALRRGIEAEVVLSLSIDAEGEVRMTELVSVRASKYQKNFIKAAERAAMRTRFHPRTVNGRPAAARGYERTYSFRLQD